MAKIVSLPAGFEPFEIRERNQVITADVREAMVSSDGTIIHCPDSAYAKKLFMAVRAYAQKNALTVKTGQHANGDGTVDVFVGAA